jgi:hypothetical protein
LQHGYFCYTPLFFRDLAKANGYEIIDLFLQIAGFNDPVAMGLDVRSEAALGISKSADHDPRHVVLCFNIHVIMKKLKNSPFKSAMEIATAGTPVNPVKALRYTSNPKALVRIAFGYYRAKLRQVPFVRWLYFRGRSMLGRI